MTTPGYHAECPFIAPVSELKIQMGAMMKAVDDMHTDIQQIKASVASIATLELKHDFHKEALARAFVRIETMEKELEVHEGNFQKMQGAKSLMIGLWTVLAGGLGAVLLKLFV